MLTSPQLVSEGIRILQPGGVLILTYTMEDRNSLPSELWFTQRGVTQIYKGNNPLKRTLPRANDTFDTFVLVLQKNEKTDSSSSQNSEV